MEHKDLIAVLDSIESLFNGNKTFTRTTKGEFVIAFDDKAKELLGLNKDDKYAVREDTLWWADYEHELTPNVSITYDALVETIRYAYDNGLSRFNNVPLEILVKDITKTNTDYSKQEIDCPLKDFSNDYELRSLIALADYPADLSEKIYEARNADNWVLKAFETFPKYNNRVFIKLSDYDRAVFQHKMGSGIAPKYIVISKNPLDYFYASYGNSFQSCFALNSSMACWYGYIPFSTTPESCMVYLSDGTVTDVSLLKGKKFHCPQMYLRCWGYANKDGELVVDKFYRSNSDYIQPMVDFMSRVCGALFLGEESGDNREQQLYDKGKNIYKVWNKYKLRFYSDSLVKDIDGKYVYFRYNGGCNDSKENKRRWRDESGCGIFTEYCKKVSDVIQDIDFTKQIELVNGILCNPKVCPVTNLFITADQEKHPLAKYFTKPVKSLAIIDCVDDKLWLSYCSNNNNLNTDTIYLAKSNDFTLKDANKIIIRNWCNESELGITLKQLKDTIKANVDSSPWDAILLKIVEDDKVTCQVFRNITREKANERSSKAV